MKFHLALVLSISLSLLAGASAEQDEVKATEVVKPVEVEESVEAVTLNPAKQHVVVVEAEVADTPKEADKPHERKGFIVQSMASFASYKQKFHRVYSSFTEMIYRQKIFLTRAIQVVISNIKYKRRQLTYYLSVNQFTDRSDDELFKKPIDGDSKDQPMGGPITGPPGPGSWSYDDEKGWVQIESPKVVWKRNTKFVSDSPDYVEYDWRKSGCFTPVKNQRDCGACYVFAITTLVEYEHCKHTGEHLAFSEQFIIDCAVVRSGVGGCDGGWPGELGPFMQSYGLDLEKDYPYSNRMEICKYGFVGNERKMGYYKPEKASLKRIYKDDWEKYVKIGPFQIGILLDNHLNFYGGGVYECSSPNLTQKHAVAVVGSGKQDEKEYWILRNSWNSDWGEEGYMRINKLSPCLTDEHSTILDATLENVRPFGIKNKFYKPNIKKPTYWTK